MQKRVLSVQDISCFGKCSNSVALPVISAAGHECVILPTALLSTHTGGFEGYTFLDLTEEMRRILAHWKTLGLRFDALYTGYFGNAAQLTLVREFFAEQPLLRLIDPVMGDRGRLYSIYDAQFAGAMRDFCRGADVITPNVTEAALLAERPFCGDTYDDAAMRSLVDALFAMDVRRVVLTGVRFGAAEIGIVAADAATGSWECLRTPYADTYFHGGGDTFASALCAGLVSGKPFDAAARDALDFTYRSIRRTEPTDTRYGLCFEPELRTI